jgi:hypothetical protein
MSLDEKRESGISSSQGAASVTPWPLSTDAVLRVLAWPRYDDVESIQRVLMVVEPLFDNKNGCLCLRYDPEVDIPYDEAVAQLQRAFDLSGRTGDLDVLFIDDKINPADWPRLGKSVNAAVSLDQGRDERRESFFSALGVEIISGQA